MVDSSTDVLTIEQRRDRAERRVARFVERFEPAYYELLCHAALPLVLTPELVSYLRNEFLREIPWIAEVDLLLSDLCLPVGYELYSMDTDVRAYLLDRGSETFDSSRMKAVANLLISYVRYLAANSSLSDRELEAQQWGAMFYLGPLKQREAVDEIVKRFQDCVLQGDQIGSELLGQAEMARLAQITQTFKKELFDYPVLVQFGALVNDVQLSNRALAAERVEATYEVTPGQRLRLPPAVQRDLRDNDRISSLSGLVADAKAQLSSDGGSRALENVSPDALVDNVFPSLEVLNFTKGELVNDENDAELALESDNGVAFPPPLKAASFKVATISLPQQPLEVFEFQTAKIEQERAGILRRLQWVVKKSRAQARRLVEPLADDLTLEMVAIPGGTFLMGSPEGEPERSSSEGPQHEVAVPDFFMGRYPVTQSQWRFVANLPQVNRELEPDPSSFKGSRLPVEQVSWYDAVEFCDRLSVHTDRAYRLPTEAEWEYACRAGTVTPFYFGDMILTEVANYNGDYMYADGPKGKNRRKTTSVNEFDGANAFGLCDMHGNVWEWCQDHWHENYEGAPTDGSAWFTDDEDARRVRRGGSRFSYPSYCRSACRDNDSPDFRDSDFGFRVSCSAPRT